MKKFISNIILRTADILEIIIGILLAISICILLIFLVSDLRLIALHKNDIESFNAFLASAFNLVIGIEFIKMLCKHTPATVIEVLLFAIARQLIVEHTSTIENLVGIISIGMLFAIRKYLFYNFDEVEKTIYRANEKVKRINLIEHIDVPHTKGETLEEVVLNEVEERKLELGVGLCIYYSGFALRIAKMKNHEVTRIEIIKSLK